MITFSTCRFSDGPYEALYIIAVFLFCPLDGSNNREMFSVRIMFKVRRPCTFFYPSGQIRSLTHAHTGFEQNNAL